MNTKILMTASALFLGIIGILLSFFPQEIANYLNFDTNLISILFLQILSSLYLGFGILNWMAKGNLIGGIYSRPLAIGNLMHFAVSAIAFIKITFKIQTNFEFILSLTIIYSIFTLCFAYIFMTNPSKINNPK
jgi:Fe2+ transport system protein B